MAKKVNWEKQVGRRLKLRDLHVFFTVAQCGSMAKAAAEMGVSQPTISESISDLENLYSVRLFDRSPRGVELTVYGTALFRRSIAVFDELKQSARDIQSLSDATAGEIRIGCQESIAPVVLAPAIREFCAKHPRVVINIDDVPSAALQLSGLRARNYDFMLALISSPVTEDDVTVQKLFDDRLTIATSCQSPWTRRRRVDLAELIDEQWLLTPPGTWNYERVSEAFHARGLPLPAASLMTLSVPFRAQLLQDSRYITAFSRSAFSVVASRYGLKSLSVELSDPPWPVVIMTLKHRTISPLAERFIKCMWENARRVVKSS